MTKTIKVMQVDQEIQDWYLVFYIILPLLVKTRPHFFLSFLGNAEAYFFHMILGIKVSKFFEH